MSNAPKPSVFNIDSLQRLDEKRISVMMPFAGNFTPVYKAISDLAEHMGLRCNRADDIWEHDSIIQDVVSLICQSSVVICDLSGKNPNVFYEAGIAHTLGKKVILLAQHIDDVPFDLRHLRVISYLANSEGITKMIQELSYRLNNLLNEKG
ncbi:hypothetical protein D6Z18_25025 [Escherichia coli]|nr:hypothetical protein [Escherichia coli]RBJ23591.1 hypothetical protein DSB62_21670 [Escherichia coli]